MDLSFTNPGFEYSLDSIMLFHNSERKEMWSYPLFHFYPQLDREKFYSLPVSQRKDYLREALRPVYEKEEHGLVEKLVKYNSYWQQHKEQIVAAFSEVCQCDFTDRLNNIAGNITLNPIEPRFLNTSAFDVFHLNSERGALGVALHEMTHFVWFNVWQEHFRDDPAEYETPHIKWVFSEMVIDPIMRRDVRLNGVNPYFADGTHVYECFKTMKLEDKPVLETLYNMYCRVSMIDFMEWGLEYCEKHENEIRAQMADTI